jgi:hypothetical protein
MFEGDLGTAGSRWPVVRLGLGSKTEVTLLSRRCFILTTHFYKRTVPCSGDGCCLCELLPARGLFYVAVFCASRISLLELGAQSASSFEQHARFSTGSMSPGIVFELSRRGRKSPVYSEFVRVQQVREEVTELNLARHVMALYKFPPPNPAQTLDEYEARCRVIAERRNELTKAELLAGKCRGVESRA